MIARVAVRDVDGLFDYIIPDAMEKKVAAGLRIVVPFGAGNRLVEGIIVELANSSDCKKLKKISRLIDVYPLCTPELMQLAKWIKDRWFCSYYKALRLVLPPGISIKKKEYIQLNNSINAEKIIGRSKIRRMIFDRLTKAGGFLQMDDLADIPSARRVILELEKKGLVTISEVSKQAVSSKFVKMAVLKVPPEDIDEIIAHISKRAPVQAKLLDILSQTGSISTADLVTFSGGAYSALQALVKKGLIDIEEKVVMRNAYDEDAYKETKPHKPTSEQKVVLKEIIDAIDCGKKRTYLLHGVTGSGKTEVFLQAIEHIIKKGKQAIVLVPEISLTPQMVERFVGRFGRQVSVFHSSLSLGERYDEWQKILSGEVSLVVGARSAVFAPFRNLGIIIIDEEQESTYKSDTTPAYHAREIAQWRANHNNALLLLASATPSIESYYNAKIGAYQLLEMKNRYNNAILPKVKIVDMANELKYGNRSIFSNTLLSEIEENLRRSEQTILFLNRRGYNTFVSCRSCGDAIKCKYCDVTLTYHKRAQKLICHYCGYARKVPKICPSCNSPYIRYFGDGTQKLEDEIAKFFPTATYIRMDMDTTSNKNSHEAILNRFRDEKIDILVGTQMVTKGLDFKNVTLVGVMAADLSLNMSDFRAYERTFSLLTQVCGRAGRGEIEGRAVIQTYQPDSFVINLAKEHDYIGFYENEIAIRERLNYPPFCDLIMLLATGEDENKVSDLIKQAVDELKREYKSNALGSKEATDYITSPIPAPLSKLKGKYRWRVLIKTKRLDVISHYLHKIIKKFDNKDVNFSVAINPTSIL